jgi:putative membrane protein
MTVARDHHPDDKDKGGRVRAAMRNLQPKLDDVGKEPDPRFSFANERTFLAWARTGLGLIGAGLIAAQVLHLGLGGAHLVLAVPAIALGGLIGITSYVRWHQTERAMRLGQPLGYSPLTRILALGIAVLAALSATLAVVAAIVK